MGLTVDHLEECVNIEISEIQRKAWECKEMARRLTADATIVLERAGYIIDQNHETMLVRFRYPNGIFTEGKLMVAGGTVDNDEVVKLLNIRGFDEFGRPDKNAVFGELPR